MRRKRAAIWAAVLLIATAAFALHSCASATVLRIYDYETGKIYVEVPAGAGDRLFFGWMHSLEKIPWHERYHIDENGDLILDEIAFPAFGAGIPENKGTSVKIENGMIVMSGIGQVFHEFTWLNSHYATRDIRLNDALVARGDTLPEHTRINLSITKKGLFHGARHHRP